MLAQQGFDLGEGAALRVAQSRGAFAIPRLGVGAGREQAHRGGALPLHDGQQQGRAPGFVNRFQGCALRDQSFDASQVANQGRLAQGLGQPGGIGGEPA